MGIENPPRIEFQQWNKIVLLNRIVVKETSQGISFKAELVPIFPSTCINLILNVLK